MQTQDTYQCESIVGDKMADTTTPETLAEHKKEIKLRRRNTKAAFTRPSKTLVKMMTKAVVHCSTCEIDTN